MSADYILSQISLTDLQINELTLYDKEIFSLYVLLLNLDKLLYDFYKYADESSGISKLNEVYNALFRANVNLQFVKQKLGITS